MRILTVLFLALSAQAFDPLDLPPLPDWYDVSKIAPGGGPGVRIIALKTSNANGTN